jgi:large subunit ribosomal protein L21
VYALVKVAGMQFRVRPDEVIRVPQLAEPVGDTIEIKDVMAIGEGDDLRFGQPFLEGASVTAEVLAHGRARKILVFKKKRRKTYQRMRGHRQNYTEIRIRSIA